MQKIISYKTILFVTFLSFLSSDIFKTIYINDISNWQKSSIIGLKLIYIMGLSIYLDSIIYHRTVKNIFNGEFFMNIVAYKYLFIILPIISILIFIIARIKENMHYSEIGDLIFFSLILLYPSITTRKNVVLVDKDSIFIFNEIISISTITKCNIKQKLNFGFKVSEVEVHTKPGNTYKIRVDNKQLEKFKLLLNKNKE